MELDLEEFTVPASLPPEMSSERRGRKTAFQVQGVMPIAVVLVRCRACGILTPDVNRAGHLGRCPKMDLGSFFKEPW